MKKLYFGKDFFDNEYIVYKTESLYQNQIAYKVLKNLTSEEYPFLKGTVVYSYAFIEIKPVDYFTNKYLSLFGGLDG